MSHIITFKYYLYYTLHSDEWKWKGDSGEEGVFYSWVMCNACWCFIMMFHAYIESCTFKTHLNIVHTHGRVGSQGVCCWNRLWSSCLKCLRSSGTF